MVCRQSNDGKTFFVAKFCEAGGIIRAVELNKIMAVHNKI
jgi:hypothetical protein